MQLVLSEGILALYYLDHDHMRPKSDGILIHGVD